jgi:hypothetical protein
MSLTCRLDTSNSPLFSATDVDCYVEPSCKVEEVYKKDTEDYRVINIDLTALSQAEQTTKTVHTVYVAFVDPSWAEDTYERSCPRPKMGCFDLDFSSCGQSEIAFAQMTNVNLFRTIENGKVSK